MTRRYLRLEKNDRPTTVATYWFAWVRVRRTIRWYSQHNPAALAISYASLHIGKARA